MYSEAKALKVIELSERIYEIVENRESMTNGDYEEAIEAVIMEAINEEDI